MCSRLGYCVCCVHTPLPDRSRFRCYCRAFLVECVRMMTPLVNNVLIIRFSSVGDIVLASLLLRTLRARFPSSRIDIVVKEEFADIVRWNPHVTTVLTFPREGGLDALHQLRRRVARTSYDLVLDLHGSLRSRLLCLGLRNVRRIEKRVLARWLLVRFKLNRYDSLDGSPSVALRYIETAKAFGVQDDGNGLEYFFTPGHARAVDDALRAEGFHLHDVFIGLCPSAKHNTKMWLKERFAEVAAALATERRLPVMLFGSESEQDRSRDIAAHITRLTPHVRVLDLSGKLSLAETAAAMDKCVVVIANDSGLMHIAAARKRPVVALFGPTVKEFGFFPFGTRSTVVEVDGLSCRPCSHIGLPACPQGHFRCMKEIASRRVIDAATALLTTVQ